MKDLFNPTDHSRAPALRAFLVAQFLLIACLAITLVGCASRWTRARADLIDPVQSLLHRKYPSAVTSLEPDLMRALFRNEDASKDVVELMERFQRVEETRAVIDDAVIQSRRVEAAVTLEIEGVLKNGERLYVRQPRRMVCTRVGEYGWYIDSDEGGTRFEAKAPGPRFVNEAAERGLDFRHVTRWHDDPSGVSRRHVHGSGAAVDDVDGNGWEDVVLVNSDRIELFLNTEGTFTKASAAWGLGTVLEGNRTCPLLSDFDNDGHPDLFVGADFGQPVFYRNTGTRFEAEDVGLVTEGMTVAACSADFNGDGYLDLFLGNHEDPYHRAPQPQGYARNAKADQLFLNQGDGTFRDTTRESGIDNPGWSLTCAAADHDNDGDVDLFIGNDFGGDSMYENDGHARFREVTKDVGLNVAVAAMSSDWGDFDGDGDFDLFVAGMSSRADWAIDHPAYPSPAPWLVDTLFRKYVRAEIREFFHGNRLFENLGGGQFREISTETGTVNTGWAWSSVWVDFDNDGLLDIYSSNGMISGPLKDDL